MRVPRKVKKQIPKGMYCYKVISIDWPNINTKPCPLSFVNELGYGDCRLLVRKYKELNGEIDLDFCLDDQCKSCGIKKY